MRKHAAFHLVHHITKPDALFRVGKTQTSAGTGMTECRRRWTQ